MNTLKFRPLRRVKKTGKIVVASYMGWNKIKCANYNKFNLIVNDDYKIMPEDEYVYTHEGDLIYFFEYNPWDVFVHYGSCIAQDFDWDEIREQHKSFIIEHNGHRSYHMRGADCSGTPSFTHWDENRISQEDTWNYYGHESFEPLTVKKVLEWLGWFLYRLDNSYLKIEK